MPYENRAARNQNDKKFSRLKMNDPIGMNFGLTNLEMLNFMKLLLNELIWFI